MRRARGPGQQRQDPRAPLLAPARERALKEVQEQIQEGWAQGRTHTALGVIGITMCHTLTM